MTTAMSEQTFFLLAALVPGPRHGYALIGEVAELSDGRLTLRVGTLYGVLDRLERNDWVRESGTEVVDGRHRRYFEITEQGRAAITAETARLSARAEKARMLLGPLEGFAQ